MSADTTAQTVSHCSCGAPLRWETRERFGERMSLALCQAANCGVITTLSGQGVQPEQGLQAYLLGPVPARRYLKPWLRLYHRASRWGYCWIPHHETCPDCNGEITVQLELPRLIERQTDPYQVVTCLICGTTSMAWLLNGEQVSIAIEGSDWNEPATAVLILKRVLEERAANTCESWTWDFLQ